MLGLGYRGRTPRRILWPNPPRPKALPRLATPARHISASAAAGQQLQDATLSMLLSGTCIARPRVTHAGSPARRPMKSRRAPVSLCEGRTCRIYGGCVCVCACVRVCVHVCVHVCVGGWWWGNGWGGCVCMCHLGCVGRMRALSQASPQPPDHIGFRAGSRSVQLSAQWYHNERR